MGCMICAGTYWFGGTMATDGPLVERESMGKYAVRSLDGELPLINGPKIDAAVW